MDDQATNSAQPGPQLVPPPTAPPKRPVVVRVFLGEQGLRAGWRFILYLIAVGILLGISIHILKVLYGGPGVDTPSRAMATEILQFLSAALPALLASRLERRPWGSYGLPFRRPALSHLVTGLAVGFVALSLLLLLIHLAHGFYLGPVQLHGSVLVRYAFLWGIAFLLVGFAEEFMFRGYSQFTLAIGSNFWIPGIVLSALFGAIHLSNVGEDWLGALQAGLVALVFIFSLWRTGTLWFAVGAHAAWDWAESFFYGVPDSGTKSIGTLFNPHFAGSKWITGGSVGPEGSAFGIVALLFIALCVHLLYPSRQWQPR